MNAKKYYSVFPQKLSTFLKCLLSCSVFFLYFGTCIALSFADQADFDRKQYDPTYKKSDQLEKSRVAQPGNTDVSDMAYIRGGKFARGSNFEQNKAALIVLLLSRCLLRLAILAACLLLRTQAAMPMLTILLLREQVLTPSMA